MHTKLLRLDLQAFGFPLTALPPKLVGLTLVFCSLELRIFAHGLGVLATQHFREPLPHAQHIRDLALLEVVPRRQILESRHLETFGAGEGHEGEAMLRRSLESLAACEVDDDAFLEGEALGFVDSHRIARDNRKLLARLARAFLDAHLGQDGYPLRLARVLK